MTRGASQTVDSNFTRGLITEFTAMNFPENAITEGDNCVYSEQGAVTRRLGMNFENNYVTRSLASFSPSPNSFAEFKWHSVGSIGTIAFAVQQVGSGVFFFTIDQNASLSSGKKAFAVGLTSFASPGSTLAQIASIPCQFTAGRGYLIVAHPLCDPFYVAYTLATDSITATKITIETRDFETLDDGLAVDERPFTLSNLHKYNLYNQGWYVDDIDTPSDDHAQVLESWDAAKDDFPSNSDVWFTFKRADGNFDPSFIQHALTNTPAPNGHYIYNTLNIDRTTETGFTGLPTVSAGAARPSSVAFYAGRAFYAGVAANKYADKLYFSQIIDSDSKFGKCYQKNDPTSDDVADLLDDDGGVISLPLIESVICMKVIADTLVVVATNGVYTISGTQQGPFKATDYTVTYISSIGGTKHLSVIEVDGGLMWWNTDGIYAITRDNIGNFQVQNVSKSTIQTLFNSIPSENLPYVKGAYNKKDQLVQWLFSSDTTGYSYDRILELNVISKAFYTYTIDTTLNPRLVGILSVGGQREVISLDNVINNALVQVQNNALQDVQVQISNFVPDSEVFKYTTAGLIFGGAAGLTYSEIRDLTYVDWKSFNAVGVSYLSYGISGYRIRGNLQTNFNSTPITFVAKYFETGRCLVSGIWDYGFRATSKQELYLVRPEVSYLIRRVKFRGKGKSLQIRFESVDNNPFSLTGWSTFDTGGTNP